MERKANSNSRMARLSLPLHGAKPLAPATAEQREGGAAAREANRRSWPGTGPAGRAGLPGGDLESQACL